VHQEIVAGMSGGLQPVDAILIKQVPHC
jgi:hypothetical protein